MFSENYIICWHQNVVESHLMWQLGSKHGTQMQNYIWLELTLKISYVTHKVHAFVCDV